MKHFLRPFHGFGVAVLGVGMGLAPHGSVAQAMPVVELVQGASPLLQQHSASQGYLGVLVSDVDADSAQKLKLKEVRGAVITLIDHDAPAGQKGLRVNDVVLKVNGQTVEGAEQFSRMMHEIPAGHTATLVISRDGAEQSLAIQLVNHRAMEHDVWNRLGTESDAAAESPGMGVLPGGGDNTLPGMFHMPIWGSTLNVGAMVEPLTEQMAEYLGIPSGLMVKQVAHKSEAATAGLKAFDVILKVGPEAITTMSDWDRALRSNQGKPVQVTILRDRKQQTLTLQVDSKRKTGELEMEELFPDESCPLVAELDTGAMEQMARESADAAKALGEQMKLDGLKLDDFKVDPKQMEEMKRQMDEFQKSFKPEDFKVYDFKIDRKQMEEMKRQMEQFKLDLTPQDFEFAPN